jgi:hypothetical protein
MLKRCLPAAIVAALCMPAQVSADSVSITVRVIQAGAGTSLPSVLFRSGGVITLPTGNDAVAITIGGMNVGGLNSRGHQPRELSFKSPGPNWDKWLIRAAKSNGRGSGFTGSAVDTSVAEDFSDSDMDDSHSGNTSNGSSGAEIAAHDRTVVFAGEAGSVSSGAASAAALLLAGVGNGKANPPAFGLLGLNGNGSLLANDSQPIANPEPTSMLLLGTGLAGLAAVRRRRAATKPTDSQG